MSYSSNKVTPLRGRKKAVSSNKKLDRNSNRSKNRISPETNIASLREKRGKIPNWLKSFRLLESSTFFLSFMLIGITLTVYGLTVLTQQTWSKEYRNLENLQQQERDFLATSESLKQQLAKEAETTGNELIPATPEQSIFIDSAPVNSALKNEKSEKKSLKNTTLPPIKLPLGY